MPNIEISGVKLCTKNTLLKHFTPNSKKLYIINDNHDVNLLHKYNNISKILSIITRVG